MNYKKQADDFCKKYGVSITSVYLGHYSRIDLSVVAQFKVTIRRGDKYLSLDFQDAIQNSWKNKKTRVKGIPCTINSYYGVSKSDIIPCHKNPSNQDILACIAQYKRRTFGEFCAEYGYDTDSRESESIYFSIEEVWGNVNRIFGDVIEELREIYQ